MLESFKNISFSLIGLVLFMQCGTFIGNTEENDNVSNSKPVDILLSNLPYAEAKELNVFIKMVRLEKDGVVTEYPFEKSTQINLIGDNAADAIRIAKGIPAGNLQGAEVEVVIDQSKAISLTDWQNEESEIDLDKDNSSISYTNSDGIASKNLTLLVDIGNSLKTEDDDTIFSPVTNGVSSEGIDFITGTAKNGFLACAYQEDQDPDENSNCENAVAISYVFGNTYTFKFLEPGNYKIRIFVSFASYDDIEGLVSTESKEINARDLKGVVVVNKDNIDSGGASETDSGDGGDSSNDSSSNDTGSGDTSNGVDPDDSSSGNDSSDSGNDGSPDSIVLTQSQKDQLKDDITNLKRDTAIQVYKLHSKCRVDGTEDQAIKQWVVDNRAAIAEDLKMVTLTMESNDTVSVCFETNAVPLDPIKGYYENCYGITNFVLSKLLIEQSMKHLGLDSVANKDAIINAMLLSTPSFCEE